MLDWLKTTAQRPGLARLLENGYSVADWHVDRNSGRINGAVTLTAQGDLHESTIASMEGRKTADELKAERAMFTQAETLLTRIQILNDRPRGLYSTAKVRIDRPTTTRMRGEGDVSATQAYHAYDGVLGTGESVFGGDVCEPPYLRASFDGVSVGMTIPINDTESIYLCDCNVPPR